MIFFKDTALRLGGGDYTPWFVITSESWADLHSFYKTWHGQYAGLTDEQKIKFPHMSPREKEALHDNRIELRLNVPNRGLNMHKSKQPVRVLIPGKWKTWLEDMGKCWIPDKYVPVLNMMLKKQYSAYSGKGLTPEMEKHYNAEIRGKVIDLLRSGEWVDEPEHPDLEFLNQQLEKIDLGRRSDLKFSSTQSLESATISEKFATPVLLRQENALEKSLAKPTEPAPAEDAPPMVGVNGVSFRDWVKT